ncbi:DUF1446 domain-containing protein [Sphingobacteriales bacterium UPWRP_1]|nr:hypothetical protein B6N25_16940 [Sphingobacteriales bacterium TSM_CSS]PSJ73462.1 DUF1446 domain-containing protein [Sphingobacteriales bacterium UPWRP_1]
MSVVRIAGAQGFYGDSPMAAIAIAAQQGADYLVHDALAELTLSILQKDRLADPNMGYARDIETLAKFLIPMAHRHGIRIVTNSGGLNPESAARKVAAILQQQGITNFNIATITGDDLLPRLPQLLQNGHELRHLDTGRPFLENKFATTHANVYIGAKSVAEALNSGANLILAGRVADPCLTLGILAHHFGWKLDGNLTQTDLNLLANGIAIGHLLECGGQASGGNSYAEWPMDYPISNLGYPIAHVSPDGSAVFTKLPSEGGKMSRNTLREQLVYEIHNPAHYITPDVCVDLTRIQLTELDENRVHFGGAVGNPRPEQLKLAIGLHEGYISEQLFFFSWPYAYQKCLRFIEAAKEIWRRLPVKIDRQEFSILGLNGIHGSAAPPMSPHLLEQMNELGVRIALKHTDANAGKIAIQAVTCLGLNGPPGVVSMPAWGKTNRVQLSLWPTLIPRTEVQETVNLLQI